MRQELTPAPLFWAGGAPPGHLPPHLGCPSLLSSSRPDPCPVARPRAEVTHAPRVLPPACLACVPATRSSLLLGSFSEAGACLLSLTCRTPCRLDRRSGGADPGALLLVCSENVLLTDVPESCL